MLTNIESSDFNNNSHNGIENWKVVYTKSRREKIVALYCMKQNIRFYLPLENKIKYSGNKKVQTTLPLFPGYIFCLTDQKEQYALLTTHHIAKILSVSNRYGLWQDLEKIFIAESSDFSLLPYELRKVGKKARIEAGPMRGYEGVIQTVKGKDRIIINVNFINRAAAVELSCFDVTFLN